MTLLSPDSFMRNIANWSIKRVKQHGAYYSSFGFFGIGYLLVPYCFSTFRVTVEYQTLTLRIIGCLLCILLIIFHQNRVSDISYKKLAPRKLIPDLSEYYQDEASTKLFEIFDPHQGYLPIYWHFTLCFCLPLMSTYSILESAFDTNWVVNSAISIFILVLLVDWMSFIALMTIGFLMAYVIYAIWTGNLQIHTQADNYYLVMYIYFFSMLIGSFFLYQKEDMVNKIKEANDNLEKLNSTLDMKVKKRTKYLKRALKARSEFLNNISHEVRTPLQGVLGISSSLVEHWDDLSEEDRYSYIRVIADSGDRLMNLVSSLLDLSKFDAGKMTFEFNKHDIIQTISDAVDELKPIFYKNKFNIKFKKPKNVEKLILNFDSVRILQVLRNLISNAFKYSFHKDIVITLSLTDEYGNITDATNPSAILVSIKDQGIGIPQNELKTIFLPFSQSSRTKSKAGGTGLGLALCAEIIHAHKGKIWAVNNYDSPGSTFLFLIPFNENVNIEEMQKLNPVHEKKSYKSPSDYHILFIDDEDFCLMSGKVILECLGFKVTTCKGGVLALEMLKENNYDLILLDLMMPDLYGTEVLKEIRNIDKTKNIPVILQSGASDHEEIEHAKSLGANDHLLKPYDKNTILSTVNRVLGLTSTIQ